MAALYDPRYDYPSAQHQSAIGRVAAGSVPSITTSQMLRKLYPDTVGPAALTDAQMHARETEPAEAMFTGADGRLYPAGHPMLTQQNTYNSDDTDITGGYKTHDPTANEISANRRGSTMMNQDPARYAPDGSSLVGDPYGTNENDVVFNSLVERYMSEGLPRDQAFAKAKERMAMGPLESLQENLTNAGTDALEFVGGIRDDGILSAEKDENGAFAPDAEGSAVPVSEQLTNPPMGMSFNPPVPALTSPSTDTGNGGTGPVLRQPTSNTARNGNAARRMTGGYTGNARGSGLPDMQIGLGERLMRMGAAGLAAGAQGPLAQMGAMTGAYNDVNQANRQAEMGTFKIEEERRQAHAARVNALAASKNKGMGAVKDFEAKNFGFYNRGVDAERALLSVGDIGTDVYETLMSNVPLFGNALISPEYQRYDQSRRNWVNAVLRRESGAVISDAEFENANRQYFPQPFDDETQLAQKAENRRTTMEGIRLGAGTARFYTPTYPMAAPTDQGGGAPDQETEALVKKYSQ